MEEQTINRLPKDWKVVRLEEAVQVLDNLRKPINSSERQKRIADKSEGELFPYYGATGQVGWIDSFITEGEYVLVGEDGAPFLDNFKEKAYKIKGKTWVNNHAHILKEIDGTSLNDFILHYLNSINYREYVNGTTRLKLAKGSLVEIPFPLPPKEILQQIVSKIEELFSELDKGIEELKTAQQQLKVYRQALLKWAFEGKLTNENVTDGALSEGWRLKTLNEIGSWKGGGTPSKSRNDFWTNGNVLWVSPKDIKSKIINNTIDKITFDAVENSTAQLIPKGSILFVVRSGILRRTLPVAITISDVTVNQDLKALTPKEVLADYIFYYVQAKNDEIRRTCSKDGTTVESIETSLLKLFQIPICSKEEQQQIVQEIESRLSVCDKIEETIANSLKQSEALRQSILRKAFERNLVSSLL